VALNRVGANCHPSHAHPVPTWQMSWREMQVLPQACEEEVERAVGRTDVERAAQRLFWRAEGNGRAAAVLDGGDGDSAKAAVVSDRKIVRIARVRSIGSVRERPRMRHS
jgi:hypothetical protein